MRKYEEIAWSLGLKLCSECEYPEVAHQKGFTTRAPGGTKDVVHWRRDRVTKPGVYEFLKLCWTTTTASITKAEAWERAYMAGAWAIQTAKEAGGMTIPLSVSRYDRLYVRSAMPDLPSNNPIYRWAHKEIV